MLQRQCYTRLLGGLGVGKQAIVSRLQRPRIMASRLKSEVAEKLDLSVIRYSRVWEDHRTLSSALQIQEDRDVVLSVTGSGDNTLHLLLDRPKTIITVDMSPAQNALMELKLVAIAHLSYEDFLCVLGETDDSNSRRLGIYHEIKNYLPTYAQEYWDSHSEILGVGLWSCSRLEKYIATYHNEHLSKVVSAEEIDGFLAAKSLEEQRSLFQKLPLDKIGEVHRWYTGKEYQTVGRSVAQLKYVDMPDESVSALTWRRFSEVCQTVPVHDNFYLSWWLRGRRGFNPASNPTLAPPFLTRDGFTKLKGLVGRVQVYTGTLEDYLGQSNLPNINKANLSDLFEYMSSEASETVFAALADKMAMGGRLAYWNLFIPRHPSPALQPKLTHLKQLSADLHKTDRVFYYSEFCVFQVN